MAAQKGEELLLERPGARGERRKVGAVKAAEQIQLSEPEFLADDVKLLLQLARFAERGVGVARGAEEGKASPPGAELLVPAREAAVVRRGLIRLVLRAVRGDETARRGDEQPRQAAKVARVLCAESSSRR